MQRPSWTRQPLLRGQHTFILTNRPHACDWLKEPNVFSISLRTVMRWEEEEDGRIGGVLHLLGPRGTSSHGARSIINGDIDTPLNNESSASDMTSEYFRR